MLADDVLRLQITVHDALLMEVLQTKENVVDDLLNLGFRLHLLVLECLEQLLAIEHLNDEVDGIFGLVDLIKGHVVRRQTDCLHNGHLFVQSFLKIIN